MAFSNMGTMNSCSRFINSEMLLLIESFGIFTWLQNKYQNQIFRMLETNVSDAIPVLDWTNHSGPLLQPLMTYIVTESAGLQKVWKVVPIPGTHSCRGLTKIPVRLSEDYYRKGVGTPWLQSTIHVQRYSIMEEPVKEYLTYSERGGSLKNDTLGGVFTDLSIIL